MTSKSTLAQNVQPAPVPYAKKRSPCVGKCTVNRADNPAYCASCLRSLAEIEGWGGYTDSEREAVYALLPMRRNRA